jgi:predicted RNA-binding Zn-ribbon protein involved in translation (DUF1610 family)
MPQVTKFTCPHCGELMEADKDAAGQNAHCASCGNEIVIPQEPIVRKVIASSQTEWDEIIRRMGPERIGMVGAGLMGLGVFLPFIKIPIVGTINYFHNAQGDGVIILVLAICAFAGFARNNYRPALWSGLAAGGVLAFSFWSFSSRVQGVQKQMSRELADNPFRGLAEGLLQGVQIEIGAYVIALGIILVLTAATRGNTSFQSPVAGGTALRELLDFFDHPIGSKAFKITLLVVFVIFGLLILFEDFVKSLLR